MADDNVVPDYILQKKLANLGSILSAANSPSTSISDILKSSPLSENIQNVQNTQNIPGVGTQYAGMPVDQIRASAIQPQDRQIIPDRIQAQTIPQIGNINDQPVHKQISSLPPLDPRDPQFQPHHRILGTILAGLAGAGGHPEVGKEWRERPYMKALAARQNLLAQLKPGLEAETEQPKLESTRNVSQAKLNQTVDTANVSNKLKSDIANETAEQRKAREAREKERDDFNRVKTQEDLDLKTKALNYKINHPLENTLEAKVKAGEAEVAKIRKEHPEFTTDKQAEDYIAEHTTLGSPYGQFAAGATSAARKEGELRGASTDESLDAQKKIEDVKTKAAIDKFNAQYTAKITDQKNQLQPLADIINHTNNDPLNPNNKIQLISRLPRTTVSKLIENGQLQPTRVLNSQELERVNKAQNTMNHISGIEQLLQTPGIENQFGPVSGRITRAKHWAGMPIGEVLAKAKPGDKIFDVDTKGLDPASPSYRLLTNMNNLLIWEVSNASGNRPAHQLFDRLAQYSARPEEGINEMKGALQGIRDNVYNTISTYYGMDPANISGSAQNSNNSNNFNQQNNSKGWKVIK